MKEEFKKAVIEEFKDPKYIDEQNIEVQVNHPDLGWIPYTCNPDDKVGGIDNDKLYPRLVASNPTPYVKPTEEETKEKLALQVRQNRDLRLENHVDPFVMNFMRWDEQPEDKQNKIKEYRKKLLDVPQQKGFPYIIDWPERDF